MFNLDKTHSIYTLPYDIIVSNAGSDTNNETLTSNSENLRDDIYAVGLCVLNAEELISE